MADKHWRLSFSEPMLGNLGNSGGGSSQPRSLIRRVQKRSIGVAIPDTALVKTLDNREI